jgi:hypothetical protein
VPLPRHFLPTDVDQAAIWGAPVRVPHDSGRFLLIRLIPDCPILRATGQLVEALPASCKPPHLQSAAGTFVNGMSPLFLLR